MHHQSVMFKCQHFMSLLCASVPVNMPLLDRLARWRSESEDDLNQVSVRTSKGLDSLGRFVHCLHLFLQKQYCTNQTETKAGQKSEQCAMVPNVPRHCWHFPGPIIVTHVRMAAPYERPQLYDNPAAFSKSPCRRQVTLLADEVSHLAVT